MISKFMAIINLGDSTDAHLFIISLKKILGICIVLGAYDSVGDLSV